MPNRLGITPEDEGDVVGSAMPQFGHFDGGVAPSVLLRQRVIEGLHGPFDLFVVLHGNTSLPAWCGYHTTTLQGVCPLHLKKSGSYFVSNPKGYTQLFRNGIVEAVRVYTSPPQGYPSISIPSVSYEKKIIQDLEQYLALTKLLDLSTPIVIALSFTNTKGCLLHLNAERGGPRGPLSVDRLVIREVRMNTLEEEPSTVLRPVFDMVWNAFGAERSYNYDDKGKWVGS